MGERFQVLIQKKGVDSVKLSGLAGFCIGEPVPPWRARKVPSGRGF